MVNNSVENVKVESAILCVLSAEILFALDAGDSVGNVIIGNSLIIKAKWKMRYVKAGLKKEMKNFIRNSIIITPIYQQITLIIITNRYRLQ